MKLEPGKYHRITWQDYKGQKGSLIASFKHTVQGKFGPLHVFEYEGNIWIIDEAAILTAYPVRQTPSGRWVRRY